MNVVRILLAAFCIAAGLLVDGCTSSSKFVDGTSVQLGAYVPWEQNLYGVELVSYINGCAVKTSSNVLFTVQRDYCATNTYLWGMVETRETTHTSVETKKR